MSAYQHARAPLFALAQMWLSPTVTCDHFVLPEGSSGMLPIPSTNLPQHVILPPLMLHVVLPPGDTLDARVSNEEGVEGRPFKGLEARLSNEEGVVRGGPSKGSGWTSSELS